MPTPTATQTPISCIGDCTDDGLVTVDEIIVLVDIALGGHPASVCPAGHQGSVTVADIIAAVNNALQGCPQDGRAHRAHATALRYRRNSLRQSEARR